MEIDFNESMLSIVEVVIYLLQLFLRVQRMKFQRRVTMTTPTRLVLQPRRNTLAKGARQLVKVQLDIEPLQFPNYLPKVVAEVEQVELMQQLTVEVPKCGWYASRKPNARLEEVDRVIDGTEFVFVEWSAPIELECTICRFVVVWVE